MSVISAWWKVKKCPPLADILKAMETGSPLRFTFAIPNRKTTITDSVAIDGLYKKRDAKNVYIILGRMVYWKTTEPFAKCVIMCNVSTGLGVIHPSPKKPGWLSTLVESADGIEIDPTLEFVVTTIVLRSSSQNEG